MYEVPLFHMRGGTSTGVIVDNKDLPFDRLLREKLLRKIMGVPLSGSSHLKQVTGLGRGTPTSNKLFIVDVVDAEKRIVKSTLAQFAAGKANIDWSVNCGNMSSAIPLYLVENKLIQLEEGTNRIEIRNTNTGKTTFAYLEILNDKVTEFVSIPGVEGSYPAVTLELNDPVGAKTGKLFPTGNRIDLIDGIEVTCLDVNVPMVIVKASDLGKSAYESNEELSTDQVLLTRLKKIWTLAGLKMKLQNSDGTLLTKEQLETSETIPKICMISASRNNFDINTRYFTPQEPHDSLAVSGGGCLASACILEGTVAYQLCPSSVPQTLGKALRKVRIENPSGVLDIELALDEERIEKILYKRSAQTLVKGHGVIYESLEETPSD